MKKIIFFASIVFISFVYVISCSKDIEFSRSLESEIGKEAECVVDGMKFTISKDTKVYEYQGKRYYFCGMSGEVEEFKKDPQKYINEYDKKHTNYYHESTNSQINTNSTKQKDRKIVYYRGCSMYPDYISDSPGKCPAGMDLIPVYEDEIGNLVVDDKVAVSLGFKLVPIKKTNIGVYIEFPGKIVLDSELYNLQSEYLSVINVFSKNSKNILDIKKRFYLLGYDDRDITSLESRGIPDDTLVAPSEYVWGIVYVDPQMKNMVRKGTEVIAQMYDDITIKGEVMFVSKVVSQDSFTIPVRVRFVNKDNFIKPGIYFKCKIKVNLSGIIIDKRAVIDTGRRKTVYVYHGNNTYILRNVEGSYIEDFFIVKEGLKEGEVIVVNGNSLLDAQAELIGVFRFGGVK